MTLNDILPGRKITIEYRTHGPLGDDILCGRCKWDGKELISLDSDEYFTDDIISSYEWNGPDYLIVWYLSRWVTG